MGLRWKKLYRHFLPSVDEKESTEEFSPFIVQKLEWNTKNYKDCMVFAAKCCNLYSSVSRSWYSAHSMHVWQGDFSLPLEGSDVDPDQQRQKRSRGVDSIPCSMLEKAAKLIKSRLTDTIRTAGDFSPIQYGFKAERTLRKWSDWLSRTVAIVDEWCCL